MIAKVLTENVLDKCRLIAQYNFPSPTHDIWWVWYVLSWRLIKLNLKDWTSLRSWGGGGGKGRGIGRGEEMLVKEKKIPVRR